MAGYNINTKYKVNDIVWYMRDNFPVQGKISDLDIEIRSHVHGNKQDISHRIVYKGYWVGTTHKFTLNEGQCFPTKQDLVNSL